MRAEVMGMVGRFEVEAERAPDGQERPQAEVTLTLRRCWRKPPETLRLRFLWVLDGVAYYAAVEEK